MIQHRGQAAILLARMNRSSKQLRYYGNMQMDLVPSAIAELMPDMLKWANDVYEYWLSHSEPILGAEIEKVDDLDFLQNYLNEQSEKLTSKHQILLHEYTSLMGDMKDRADRVLKQSIGGNLNITMGLNELGAEKEMINAQEAGYLDYKFQPIEGMSRAQLKTLAFAIGTRINIPLRRRWVLFEEQWNIKMLNTTQIPNPKLESIQEMLDFYSDVNFTDLFCPSEDIRFKTPFSSRRIKTMFSSLIKKGYVDPDTTEQQMLAIFGKEEFDQPINWLKDLRQLAYFVDTAIAPTNKDYWAATSCCFVVKGETPNRGSLKSALGAVKEKGIYETYAPEILCIAQYFNRPMRLK